MEQEKMIGSLLFGGDLISFGFHLE